MEAAVAMYDDGSREEAVELAMLKLWCQAAFEAGRRKGYYPDNVEVRDFEQWWAERDE
jgi:hypothetical protein